MVSAPLSLVVTACAPVADVRRTLTPALAGDAGPTALMLVDLGGGRDRIGGSCLAQVYGRIGDAPPDLDDPARLVGFFAAIRELRDAGLLLAYHDRSDGGLAVTLLEMAFAGRAAARRGPRRGRTARRGAFRRGARRRAAGARARTSAAHEAVLARTRARRSCAHGSARPRPGGRIRIAAAAALLIDEDRLALRAAWSETSWRMQRLRDEPACADEERDARLDRGRPGPRLAR